MASIDPTTGQPLTDPSQPSNATATQPDMVADRVNTLMDSGSPLVTAARTRANQDANSRGLLNSSIATGAGETAAYGAALPIAEADSSAANALNLQNVQGTQAQGLADTEAQYKTLLQSDASASQLLSNATNNIATINNDQTTSADVKNNNIAQQAALLKSGLSVIGGIGNLNLQGLLDFS